MVRSSSAFVIAFVLASCAHATPAPVVAAPEPVVEPPPEPGAIPETAPSQIRRADLTALHDQGFGRFLALLRVEAVLVNGRFVGFRFRSWRDPQHRFDEVPLQPGDVIVRVNGMPIERPEQAFTVWNGLLVSSELWVEYVREGSPGELRYPIVD